MPFIRQLQETPYWQHLTAPPNLDDLMMYVVKDVLPHNTGNGGGVLLLESPHVYEVLRGHALAGTTGIAVTNALADALAIPDVERCWPFGELLRAIHDGDELRATCARLSRVGVMNVCDIPMQKGDYCRAEVRAFGEPFLESFATILNCPGSYRRRSGAARAVDAALVADLCNRIEDTPTNSYFIPCGKVAWAFFHKAGATNHRPFYPRQVPHPVRGNLESLVAAIQCYMQQAPD